ncbi:putative ATP-grasp enzyme [Geoglobus ahangari]|uniref:Putative ATP-grasp enzyme n=1 Tax=Geoglobus ahangari TaxID=113653 RepID=A0A0F7DBK5_9EURY|nr:ATP-grasp domain-containing protein [Geoglobus ahangari]AKG91251.1 putative ATP-grasp enzyme [Geoglobus ahangari]
MKTKVLVSDGDHKNALAILRTFRNKYEVDVTTPFPKFLTLTAYSRYVKNVFVVNDENEDIYQKRLFSILARNKYDVFLPVGLKTYIISSKFRDELLGIVNSLVPTWDSMKIAYNKDATMEFAKKIGIPVPKTIVVRGEEDIRELENFPIVLKSSDEAGKFIRYCNDVNELRSGFWQLRSESKTEVIAQEYIRGYGVGFYSVCKGGKMYAVFMHRRLKEFPITGGPSAVAESFYSKKLFKYGKKICKKLKWTGPIMAEFKYSPEKDEFYLIEINPKLWGSLDLTISAGVNIPEIIMDLAMGNDPEPIKTYKKVKFRWVFPDELKVLMSGGETISEFLRIDKATYTNVSLKDPLPTMFQMAQGFVFGTIVLLSRKRKFPHGVVKT